MTREDIIRMALDAGAEQFEIGGEFDSFVTAFAALVVSAEREACARLRETLHPFDLHNRSEMLGVMNQGLDDYAAAIRARQ